MVIHNRTRTWCLDDGAGSKRTGARRPGRRLRTKAMTEEKRKSLYIWAQDQAHVAPDFLAVINFDEESSKYGKVIKTVPVPPPGNIGNEPHHCHLNSNEDHPGMRWAAQPVERTERDLLFRRDRCEPTRGFCSPPKPWNRASPTTSCPSRTAAS